MHWRQRKASPVSAQLLSTVEVSPVEDVRSRELVPGRRAAGRYSDYVRLYAASQKILLMDQERELLKVGLTDFGLSLEEARGILYGTATDYGVALESQVERHLQTYLIEHRNTWERRRAAKGKDSASLSRKRFEQAVDFYQTLTQAALSRDEARKRVKTMVVRMGMQASRDWSRLGSRKWFNKIPT